MDEAATPQELITGTDWGRLKVFFGPGAESGDVRPVNELLTVLAHGVPAQQARAAHELGEAINHQCSVTEATAPAILVVAALLRHPATAGVKLPAEFYRSPPPLALRAELLELIGSVTVDVGHAAEESARRFGFPPSPAELAVRATRPALFAVVRDLLDDPDPDIRHAAARAITPLLEDPELAPHGPALLPRAEAIAADLPRHRPRGWPRLIIPAASASFSEPPPW
ncbi:hypothetical protein [Actinomadura litoris]|uniref:hypothetical protein n=1 Tax=Actinomadura litoris TaxID=2678616 RepID=UPI001FA75621|nr:hypothetical protein [Actinomadura litoris]